MKDVRAIASLFAIAALAAGPALAQGDGPGGGPSRTAAPSAGEQIFHSTCAACHMHDAKGATGAGTVPALASNPKLGVAAYPITIVLEGKGVMPGFDEYLSPAQIAEVLTYVRTHFGNAYAKPVTAEDVQKIAATHPHR